MLAVLFYPDRSTMKYRLVNFLPDLSLQSLFHREEGARILAAKPIKEDLTEHAGDRWRVRCEL